LLVLSENDSLIPPISNWLFLNSLPVIKPNNPARVDRIMNTLRLAGLGFYSRKDGSNPLKLKIFLEDTFIGNDSIRGTTKILLDDVDLSLGIFNRSVFNKTELKRANFNHAELKGSTFSFATLDGANFSKADLSGAMITNSFLEDVTFDDVILDGATFRSRWVAQQKDKNKSKQICDSVSQSLQQCNMTNLKQSSFKRASLIGVNFKNAYLAESNFQNANLTGADLTGADLTGADLTNANLTNVNLTSAKIGSVKGFAFGEEPDEIKKNLQNIGVTLCDTSYYKSNYLFFKSQIRLFDNCKDADLSGLDLRGVDFQNIDLTNADFNNSNLMFAKGINEEILKKKVRLLCNTKLPSGKISFEKCQGADLSEENLSGLNLQDDRIDLTNSNLKNATKVDFSLKAVST
jgi:uncharacterized protein YjbI with pentapeptide repeats